MNKPFSIYLDLVRFLAACLVYMYHSNQRWLIDDFLPVSNYGHSSVIVFFVLSGFVIAYITDVKEDKFSAYAASRLSRIYSVALPAVILTLLLDAVGRHLNPVAYSYPFDNFLLRAAASFFLLNEVWFVSITSFSNVPYWSICYEAWYYIGFALIVFLPKRFGFVAVVSLVIILGPKIVLLAPIWALGVILYRWKSLQNMSEIMGWVLVLVSGLGLWIFGQVEATERAAAYFRNIVGAELHAQFTFSKFFPTDYILGILVFLNFAGMRGVSARIAPLLLKIERPVRFLAGYTLTLYLLHQPLFLFWGSVLRGDPAGYNFWGLTTALVAASVFVIGYITESRRHLLKKRLEPYLQQAETWVRQRYAS